MSSSGQARKKQGRKKVTLAKMENESNLQVTFSKRRNGIFKKAAEICTLTGAETGIVVFSPGRKAFSFGHPSVHNVAERFLTRNPNPNPNPQPVNSNMFPTNQDDLDRLAYLESQLQAEKKRGEELRRIRDVCGGSMEGLNLQQLQHLKIAIMDFDKKLKKHVEEAVKNNPTGAVAPRGEDGSSDVIPYDEEAGEEFVNPGFTSD